MFEAVFALCAGEDGPCRAALVPGYEAASREGCAAALAADPPAERGAECRAAGAALAFEEVAPGVFVHAGEVATWSEGNGGDIANLGFVVGGESVAVVDAGSTRAIAEGVWRAIRAETGKPVSHAILTHMHPDHVLGAGFFADAGAEVVAHEGLERALADRLGSYLARAEAELGPEAVLGVRAVEVDRAVTGRASVDLGGRVLDLRAWETAHSESDLTVLDGESGILFAGDLVFEGHVPALDGSLLGWRAVLAELSGLDLAGVVPGHGAVRLDWPEGGAAQAGYLELLERQTRAAIEAGERLGEAVGHVAAGAAPEWRLFDVFNPRNVTIAYTELEWE